jgi:hypothetical protein
MNNRYDGPIVIAAATATNLFTALAAAGYGGAAQAFLKIKAGGQTMYIGNSSAVDNTNGRPVATTVLDEFPGVTDLSRVWIYIVAGDTIYPSVQSQ